jgi:hypothetical protein
MKKIISFSIWGSNSNYTDGLLVNIELAKIHYPGWIVRVYYQSDMPDGYIFCLKSAGAEVIPMPYFRQEFFGAFWRFNPINALDVERFIVRDADARLSIREADAVQEWIESGKPFHIMRDHPQHNIQILAGMWGAVPGCIPNFSENMRNFIETVKPYTGNPRGPYHGIDQDFLAKHAWPHIKDNHIAHGIPYYKNELPFRVDNPDGYRIGT